MKLQRREKILAYAAGGLLAVAVGYFLLFAGDSRSDAQNSRPIATSLTDDVVAEQATGGGRPTRDAEMDGGVAQAAPCLPIGPSPGRSTRTGCAAWPIGVTSSR